MLLKNDKTWAFETSLIHFLIMYNYEIIVNFNEKKILLELLVIKNHPKLKQQRKNIAKKIVSLFLCRKSDYSLSNNGKMPIGLNIT